ncbi:hypothetical protein HanIR_Chr13g0651141 [Helianthus annuus]|nr:hypothetical protein HanIR_Chr13g0651141 [Helianthus annuus]
MYFPKPKKQLHISPSFKKLPNYPYNSLPVCFIFLLVHSQRLILLNPTHHGRSFFFFRWFAATSSHPPLPALLPTFLYCELSF